ncbi:MAG TPA: aminoglycoside 6-adenylyltransferase [Clostridia bacterium]|nr:aminoglycoside 6-adenylyltransferase [Clostridia bacterium]
MDRGFRVNLGKGRDGVRQALSPEQERTLLDTYPPAEEEAVWKAVNAMAGLFEDCAKAVAERMGFARNGREAANGLAFVHHLRALPRDARDMDPPDVSRHS